MGLLRADLTMLANLPATAAGRRVLSGTALGLGLFALLSWWVASEIVRRPHLLQMLHERTQGDSLRGLLGAGLTPCLVAATWLGLSLAQRQLFEAGELPLWRASPLPGWRLPVQVLLRAVFVVLCWTTALSAPFAVAVLRQADAPWTAYALLPLALLTGSAPLLAALLGAQILLVRFCSGRWLRIVLAVLAAAASVGFWTWLLLGLFQAPGERLSQLTNAAAAADSLPWTIDAGATLLATAARGEFAAGAAARIAAWLGGAAAAFALLARLHPGAVERHQLAGQPIWRFARSRWPSGVAATVRRKEFAQLVQQPGALLGFLLFAFLVFALAQRRVAVAGILADPHLPDAVAHFGAMLALWFVAVLLVLYAHMGRLALWDGAQWPLYVASPAQPSAILRGKLTAVGLFLLWPLLLVAVMAMQLFGATHEALLPFLATALAGTAAALGVLAAVGTWPRLVRPDEGGQIVQGSRSFLAALALVFCFEVTVAPAVVGWLWLQDRARTVRLTAEDAAAAAPAVVAASVAFGLLVLAVGYGIGCWNYRRLLAPRP